MKRFSKKKLSEAMGSVAGLAPLGKKVALRPRVLSSGVDSFDVLTGIGGFPEGRMAILHGPQASGKTTLALHAAAAVQAIGGVVIYLDFEHKLSLEYAEALGVNIEDLIYDREVEIRSIEHGFGALEAGLRALRAVDEEAPILAIWDSMQSVAAERAFKKDWGEGDYNGEAKAYSDAFKRFTPVLAHTRAIWLGISQVRVDMAKYAQPGSQTVGVGKASLHAANMVYQWKKPKAFRPGGGTEREGDLVKVVCLKNQSAPPAGELEMQLIYGCGVEPIHSLYEAAYYLGLATQRGGGGWWAATLPDGTDKRIQSLAGLQKWQTQDPEAFAAWRQFVLATGSGVEVEGATE
ncbi:MAG: hypothetical protein GY871_04175 [Actinomycetales bacterium]|nr:hypothetical protein [Actinomycetales bacterium]